jgi:hypothetical protein
MLPQHSWAQGSEETSSHNTAKREREGRPIGKEIERWRASYLSCNPSLPADVAATGIGSRQRGRITTLTPSLPPPSRENVLDLIGMELEWNGLLWSFCIGTYIQQPSLLGSPVSPALEKILACEFEFLEFRLPCLAVSSFLLDILKVCLHAHPNCGLFVVRRLRILV